MYDADSTAESISTSIKPDVCTLFSGDIKAIYILHKYKIVYFIQDVSLVRFSGKSDMRTFYVVNYIYGFKNNATKILELITC